MKNEIMSLILTATGLMMLGMATILARRLGERGIPWPERGAFSTMLVLNGAYILWIARLFWQDRLGDPNYDFSLWAVRILLLLATSYAFYCLVKWPRSIRGKDATQITGEHEL